MLEPFDIAVIYLLKILFFKILVNHLATTDLPSLRDELYDFIVLF